MARKLTGPVIKPTAIVCVVDKSGSMGHLRKTAVDEFNRFLLDQQGKPGEATLSLILFDTNVKFLRDTVPLGEVAPMTYEDYTPGGNTALYDAIANAIFSTERFIGNMDFNVVFTILTDGQENSSKEYKRKEDLMKLITEKQGAGWVFMYLSSDPSAFTDAGSIGISASNTVQYTPTHAGYTAVYGTATNTVSAVRDGTWWNFQSSTTDATDIYPINSPNYTKKTTKTISGRH